MEPNTFTLPLRLKRPSSNPPASPPNNTATEGQPKPDPTKQQPTSPIEQVKPTTTTPSPPKEPTKKPDYRGLPCPDFWARLDNLEEEVENGTVQLNAIRALPDGAVQIEARAKWKEEWVVMRKRLEQLTALPTEEGGWRVD